MARAENRPNAATRTDPEAFSHLPDAISVEDTVTSIRGDSPPDPSGERNAFIDAALNAGG
jgi:hypothetical protein